MFVIVELRSKEPIVNLRVFRNLSFASGNFIQAISFFVLFGSIVLLPLYLQQLMGYTSYLAGLALAPGGVATLIAMPTAGKLVTKVNPKWILFTGLSVTAYSMFMMSVFNLNVDLTTVIWSRIIMGFGLGFVFIPLISMAFSRIPKEEMGNATSIFNLLRNLGGSFGVAFITTFLARRTQLHQFLFVEHLNPLDPHYRIGFNQAANALMGKPGFPGIAKDALIYQQLLRQSAMNAYRDTFFISGAIMLCILPLIFLLKQSKQKNAPVVH
jgi:DHA2 family multidrug resistance protein